MTAQRGERVECRGDADCPATEHIHGCFAEEREHLVYVDQNGEPDECTEDCPGCHWEGNADCEAIRGGCDICDPDGDLFRAQELARADHGITS